MFFDLNDNSILDMENLGPCTAGRLPASRTIQKTLKQRCFSDLLALQRALQKGCTNAVFRSLQ